MFTAAVRRGRNRWTFGRCGLFGEIINYYCTAAGGGEVQGRCFARNEVAGRLDGGGGWEIDRIPIHH